MQYILALFSLDPVFLLRHTAASDPLYLGMVLSELWQLLNSCCTTALLYMGLHRQCGTTCIDTFSKRKSPSPNNGLQVPV